MQKIDSALEIEKVNNTLSEIHFFELDNSVVSFFKDNLNHFCKNAVKIAITKDRGFAMTTSDYSIFKIEFIPSYVSVNRINIELKNLGGIHTNRYSIVYEYDNTIITHQTQFINDIDNDVRISKKYVETKYIDQRQAYQKKIDTLVKKDSFDDYIKQEEIFYPELNDIFYKSIISVGNEMSDNPTSISYTKGYGISNEKQIDVVEFNNNIHKKQNKVLKIIFRNKKV